MKLDDITISTDGVNWEKCLGHWHWLLNKSPEFTIYLVTKFAELLLVDNDGCIWFLSTSGGSYEKVANSETEFFELLGNEEEFDFYFMPQVIELLTNNGLSLNHGDCFGFITPSIFAECEFKTSNFKVTPTESYLIGLGDMLGSLQETKNGDKVTFNVVS